MKSWIKIKYKDGWFPEGNTCILTDAAEAGGRWAGEKYAIFDLDEMPHVAFWPMKPIIVEKSPVSKSEAEKLLIRTTNGHVLWEDYKACYGS